MPMTDLGNLREVSPLGRRGVPRRPELLAALGAPADTRLALLSLGGFGFDIDVSAWPRLPGWRVISGMALRGRHPDVIALDSLPLTYIDVFASVDAVISKLGYGTVAEAAINGVPVLYTPRDGWPEEPFLADWLDRHGRAAVVCGEDLHAGAIVPLLEALAARSAPRPVEPTGAEEAAAIVAELFSEPSTLPGTRPAAV
jgi:UDP:flavonoid glycosyltransferase YjiC (YdhE family)